MALPASGCCTSPDGGVIGVVLIVVAIQNPFRGIAEHVVNSVRVRLAGSNRMPNAAAVGLEPRDAGRRAIKGNGRAAARRVLPLRFRGQTSARSGAVRLGFEPGDATAGRSASFGAKCAPRGRSGGRRHW